MSHSNTVFTRLIEQKQRLEGLSIREVGRQSGLAHTTITRVLAGDNLDLATLTALCKWLGVSTTVAVASLEENALLPKVTLFLEANPPLANLFDWAIGRLEEGTISQAALNDVMSYMVYRLTH